jgi:hypothetical protein
LFYSYVPLRGVPHVGSTGWCSIGGAERLQLENRMDKVKRWFHFYPHSARIRICVHVPVMSLRRFHPTGVTGLA